MTDTINFDPYRVRASHDLLALSLSRYQPVRTLARSVLTSTAIWYSVASPRFFDIRFFVPQLIDVLKESNDDEVRVIVVVVPVSSLSAVV